MTVEQELRALFKKNEVDVICRNGSWRIGRAKYDRLLSELGGELSQGVVAYHGCPVIVLDDFESEKEILEFSTLDVPPPLPPMSEELKKFFFIDDESKRLRATMSEEKFLKLYHEEQMAEARKRVAESGFYEQYAKARRGGLSGLFGL